MATFSFTINETIPNIVVSENQEVVQVQSTSTTVQVVQNGIVNHPVPGATGPTGPTGPQGPAGNDGVTGPTGATGTSIQNASINASGDLSLSLTDGSLINVGTVVGPTGPRGYAGSNGPTGPTGPTGNDGATGPTGPQGPTGPHGATGPQGNDGPTGPTGPQGADSTVPGPTGPQGPGFPILRSSDNIDLSAIDGYLPLNITNIDPTTTSWTVTQPIIAYATNLGLQTHYVSGIVSSITTSSINIQVIEVVGTGTVTTWAMVLGGVVGPTGATGPQGNDGPTGPQGPTGTSVGFQLTTSTGASVTLNGGGISNLELSSSTYIQFDSPDAGGEFFAVGLFPAGLESSTTSSFLYTTGAPFNIYVDGSRWWFNQDGSLTFPDGTQQSTASTESTLNYTGITGSTQVQLDTIDTTQFDTVKYLVRVRENDGNGFHIQEIVMFYDGTNIGFSEYGIVTNGDLLGTFTADVSGSNMRLLFTPVNAALMSIRVIKTLMAV